MAQRKGRPTPARSTGAELAEPRARCERFGAALRKNVAMTRNSLSVTLLALAAPSSAIVPPVETVCFDGDAAINTKEGYRLAGCTRLIRGLSPEHQQDEHGSYAPPGDAGAAKIAAALESTTLTELALSSAASATPAPPRSRTR